MKSLWGLVEYKPQWGLTSEGWLVIFLTVVILMVLFLTRIHPFLAYSSPVEADALVVEGWIGDEAVKEAMAEFDRGDYKVLIATGLPLYKGFYLSEFKSLAELTAQTLIYLGFDAEKLVVIPCEFQERNRTYSSALAIKSWLDKFNEGDSQIGSLNVYTVGLHARRTLLNFRRVFSPDINVGVICYEKYSYNRHRWWMYSGGVRGVIFETVGYVYTRLFIGRI